MRESKQHVAARIPRRTSFALFCLAGASLTASYARRVLGAEPPALRVIVHPTTSAHALEREIVADMFLKKVTRWPGGDAVRPVDLRPDDPTRRRFSEAVLRRSVQAVRSYWQQRIFSGRDVPPPELDSEASVVAFVSRFPGAIGYVSGAAKLVGVAELGVV